jgi:hypothetical protein
MGKNVARARQINVSAGAKMRIRFFSEEDEEEEEEEEEGRGGSSVTIGLSNEPLLKGKTQYG